MSFALFQCHWQLRIETATLVFTKTSANWEHVPAVWKRKARPQHSWRHRQSSRFRAVQTDPLFQDGILEIRNFRDTGTCTGLTMTRRNWSQAEGQHGLTGAGAWGLLLPCRSHIGLTSHLRVWKISWDSHFKCSLVLWVSLVLSLLRVLHTHTVHFTVHQTTKLPKYEIPIPIFKPSNQL